MARVMALSARMRAFAEPSEPLPKPHTADPMVAPTTRFAPRAPRIAGSEGGTGTPPDVTPSPPSNQTLIFTGNPATSQMIADGEFHNSVRDLTTENWRRSIIEARERARQRGMKWIG
jgi:hypothetical protein